MRTVPEFRAISHKIETTRYVARIPGGDHPTTGVAAKNGPLSGEVYIIVRPPSGIWGIISSWSTHLICRIHLMRRRSGISDQSETYACNI